MHDIAPYSQPVPNRARQLGRIAATALFVLGLFGGVAVADDPIKAVYHVSDEDKVGFALNNIQNHIDGVGGKDAIEVVLVAHGPAVKQLVDIDAVDRVRNAVAKLQEQGVVIEACGNTLAALDLDPDELLANIRIAERGGVTRIGELQTQGYVYIRP
jgi:intracellular sulfur oxidation DsrE/DsrF family protein